MRDSSREFRVVQNRYGVAIYGDIRAEQLVVLLNSMLADDLELIPDRGLAEKLGATLAIPWQEETGKQWHIDVDKSPNRRIATIAIPCEEVPEGDLINPFE